MRLERGSAGDAATTKIKKEAESSQPAKMETECFFCNDSLPSPQSDSLLALRERLRQLMTPNKKRKSWRLVGALGEYCKRHKAEMALAVMPIEDRWPAEVDFETLESRIDELNSDLREVWLSPQLNCFYMSTMLQVGRLGMDRAFNQQGDFDAADMASVG